MQIILQVDKFLKRATDNGTTHNQIAREAGLSPAKLTGLRQPDPVKIDRTNLEKLCMWLIDNNYARQAELPGALFAFEPSQFWDLLAERERIQTCSGVRRDRTWGDLLGIAADWKIQTNVLYRITSKAVSEHRGPALIDQTLVETWTDRVGEDEIIREATKVHRGFIKDKRDKASVYFGSVKSNPAIELAIANGFTGAKPFESEDAKPTPNERSCPFFLLYRDEDPRPPSFCAGTQLSENHPGNGPGYYYEDDSGKWQHVPLNKVSDVALVYYRFDKISSHLEMVLGGFSGESTRCLADFLRAEEPEQFWPPIYSDQNLSIGIYLVKFTFRNGTERSMDSLSFRKPVKSEVIALSEKVVVNRMRRIRDKKKKGTE